MVKAAAACPNLRRALADPRIISLPIWRLIAPPEAGNPLPDLKFEAPDYPREPGGTIPAAAFRSIGPPCSMGVDAAQQS